MPRVKQFNEAEVLDKAIHLFWTKGYHATSIQDLVTHLGINRASLYSTYGDKKQLFVRAFHHYQKQNTDRIRRFFKEQASVTSGLKALFDGAIEESVQDVERKGCFVVNTTTELIPGDPDMLELLEENKHTFEELFLDFLQTGVESGEISADKDLVPIASMFFTLYNGLKVVAKVERSKESLKGMIEAALGLLK